MPYRDLTHASDLANRGGGSLVASLVTDDPAVARHVTLGSAAWHGRFYITGADSAKEATGTARRCRIWCMAVPVAPVAEKS